MTIDSESRMDTHSLVQNIRNKSNLEKLKFVRQCSKYFDETMSYSPPIQGDQQDFTVLKTLSCGEYSKLFLARPELGPCKRSLEQALVLKGFNKSTTTEAEFLAELKLNYFLSPHPNIVTSYNVAFSWDEYHMYPLEHAPYGSLTKFIKKDPLLTEGQVKAVAQQISCALEFMHSLNLVHREIVPENILVFQKDMSLVKISDFGSTVPSKMLLTKTHTDIGFAGSSSPSTSPEVNGNKFAYNSRKRRGPVKLVFVPPEIQGMLPQEKYHSYPSIDVWQMGMLLFTCMTGGSFPWKFADYLQDPSFSHYCDWAKRKCIKAPSSFQTFSPRFIRLLKRMLEPKPTKRCDIQEVRKYLKDDWFADSSSKSAFTINLGLNKSTSFNTLVGVARSNSDSQTNKTNNSTKTSIECKKSYSNAGQRRRTCRIKCQNPNSELPRDTSFRISCNILCKQSPQQKSKT